MQTEYLTPEEIEYARASPILEFYYTLLSRGRELQKQGVQI